ncbi:uncharacterized protein BDZ99DRAFT_52050 [Mytilinidion resinicola]|uniref:BHLH domain-containing protein n=1 Tax=Mytilinidion resinicola TaxID=574789 RepID=A0A6A6YID5_9PEZI|nr:uncharacterized protein BDZ99DRAFT_52050 [Mytilinidion resinicola]KAF2808329.1 hypothetical protein BDZ99DRAFT_52050 [Mytilinidion resinicola]
MSLNWNAFLTEEGLNLPNDRWADAPRTTAGRSSDANTSSSTSARQSFGLAQESADTSAFESSLLGTGDNFFSDAYYNPNDYFLSDLEVLQPFGDTIAGENSTSESSPEPTSGISASEHTIFQPNKSLSQHPASRATQSPQSTSTKRPNPQRSRTYPNQSQDFTSMFSKPSEAGFVEDLTFPNGPTGFPNTKTTAQGNAVQNTSAETTQKRNRQGDNPDAISACWTSPLCPNHSEGGTPPNPSTCGGGCAPFLFDDALPTPTTIDSSLLNTMNPQDIPDGVVEIQSRIKKRTESDSSREPSGRQFSKSSSAEIQPRLKSEAESSHGSPEDQLAPLPEEKGKSRRRLPHNQVERKYRESLNTQLDSLRRVVPALHQNQQRVCDSADIEDLPTPSKPSKAVVLASATAYIRQIEKDKKNLADENQLLKARVKALQALVKCDDCSLMQYVMNLKIQNQT